MKGEAVACRELMLLLLLAFLWGSSYLLIRIALTDFPPLTLIALRVLGAFCFLYVTMRWRSERLPGDLLSWRRLMVQAFLNAIGAWTVLAWGQQFVDAGLASVLNSTSPVFVLLFTALVTRHEPVSGMKVLGAALGLAGVSFVVGIDVFRGLGQEVAGQLACLAGAMLYGGAALFGRRLVHSSALVVATGTMFCAVVVLVPAALIFEEPLKIVPGRDALLAVMALSLFCTGFALLLYFRLLRTLGALGVASQSYLRAVIGVLLGIVVLGESMSLAVLLGVLATLAGVVLINSAGFSGLKRG
ncbi:DMT family transporter [Kiloniella sp. b19]|uniref:DMT family transporter n=1 Tax=Kiloniella sp. GXU_MW_B19 TaxID=3141326 RepID=UPI0031D122DF